MNGQFIPGKSQYYVSDGYGRDTYIYNINGGFSPEKKATRIHEVGMLSFFKWYFLGIGSFVVQK